MSTQSGQSNRKGGLEIRRPQLAHAQAAVTGGGLHGDRAAKAGQPGVTLDLDGAATSDADFERY